MYSNQAQPVPHVHRADLRVVTDGAGQSIALEASPSGLHDQMQALSHVAREQLARRWSATQAQDTAAKPKRVYYLSMEFLMGVFV